MNIDVKILNDYKPLPLHILICLEDENENIAKLHDWAKFVEDWPISIIPKEQDILTWDKYASEVDSINGTENQIAQMNGWFLVDTDVFKFHDSLI